MENKKASLTINDLREWIEKYKKDLLDIDTVEGNKVVEVLTLRDEINDLVQKLEQKGIDLSVERSKLDSLDHLIKDKKEIVWKKLKSSIDPSRYRKEKSISPEKWWWYLDNLIKEEKRQYRNKWIKRVVIGAAVIAALYVIFTYVIPKPPPYVACIEKANKLLEDGKLNPALETYKKAISIDPKQGSAYLMAGVIYEFLGEKEKAAPYFANAKKHYKSLNEFYLQRGMAWLRLGEFKKAEEDAKEALKINSKSAEAHFLLGNAYEAQNKIAKAIAEFSIVSEMNADPKLTVIARYKIGMLALRGIASSPKEKK